MPRAYVSIGSNIDKERNVRSALRALSARFGKLTVSPIYENRAVGFDGENFLNLVVSFDTAESAQAIAAALLWIENAHGRVREAGNRFNARTLDLDLLLYGNAVINEPSLQLPRAEIREHAFVLRPLADIAADVRDPVTGETY
ncbi:MAG: 2-amino-4-hydroxy-6-hydroxymethyldihydropteridine diphosphokinase, partial [Pseudomonadota bacterium]